MKKEYKKPETIVVDLEIMKLLDGGGGMTVVPSEADEFQGKRYGVRHRKKKVNHSLQPLDDDFDDFDDDNPWDFLPRYNPWDD